MFTPTIIPNFIALVVKEPLDKPVSWFAAVRDFAPSGTPITVQVEGPDGGRVSTAMVHRCDGMHRYIVPLARDLSEDEVAPILDHFSDSGIEDFDIEASISAPVAMQSSTADVSPDAYEGLCTALAKREHEAWVRSRTDAGWRYGLVMSFEDKTHPLLMSWDKLPEKHRKPDRDGPQAVLDLLRDQGLVLVAKSEIDAILRLMRGVAAPVSYAVATVTDSNGKFSK